MVGLGSLIELVMEQVEEREQVGRERIKEE